MLFVGTQRIVSAEHTKLIIPLPCGGVRGGSYRGVLS